MKLTDFLVPDGIRVGLDASGLAEALRALLEALPPEAEPPPELREKFARDLAFGSVGEVVRLTSDVVAVLAPRSSSAETELRVGVASEPFTVTAEGKRRPGRARVVLLFLSPLRPSRIRSQVLPTLTRYLKEGEGSRALAQVQAPDEVLALEPFMELSFDDELKVEAALTPVSYRVYPDTPLDEVLDLMVRRELHAVPVVGEGYEVMGIITAGDALRDLLPRRQSAAADDTTPDGVGRTARDVMTRTVMCVSEDESLMDAASLMVNRGVEQLPVVREGELVGFLTRDAVLRVLFGR
jgi:CBS domain-containing protein